MVNGVEGQGVAHGVILPSSGMSRQSLLSALRYQPIVNWEDFSWFIDQSPRF
jgi:hypothetical protein